jgi:hypothetical protein
MLVYILVIPNEQILVLQSISRFASTEIRHSVFVTLYALGTCTTYCIIFVNWTARGYAGVFSQFVIGLMLTGVSCIFIVVLSLGALVFGL